jgi:hypothetical protein
VTTLLALTLGGCLPERPQNAEETGVYPKVFPSDFGAAVPVNIAPLNFRVDDECDRVFLSVRGKNENLLEYSFDGNSVKIPVADWSKFLDENKGDSITLTVFLNQDKRWLKYKAFSYFVAPDPIDPFLVYRLIFPGYQTWNMMGIYQRCLSDFSVDVVLDSRLMPYTCMNCHAMAANNPDNMLLHLRENNSGTIIIQGKKIEKLNTKTQNTFSAVGFPYWHPSAKYIAFSIDKVRQLFPASGHERAHALDMESDMVIYDVAKNEFITSPLIFSPDAFEAFPCFSPDGTTLYFVTAKATAMPKEHRDVRYSLCAVAFDGRTGQLGQTVDTLISSARFGKSVTMPRVSPDGRHIMVTATDHGNFPAYYKDADLYQYDTEDSSLIRVDMLNSGDVESYHSWSSNGRWVAFGSRRMDGLYMNVYLAYCDRDGVFHKPFLLPQEDPDFYRSSLYSFNIPEFSVKPVQVGPYDIERVAKTSKGSQVRFDTTH